MIKLTHKTVCIALIGLLLSACVEEPTMLPNTNRGNFEALWSIIDTRYCYLDYKKIDWDSIYTVYSPKVDSVTLQTSLFDLMGSMLNELQDGHVNLISSFDRSRYTAWYSTYPANFSSALIFNENYLGDNYRIAGGLRYSTISKGTVGYVYYNSFANNFSQANLRAIFEAFKDCKGLIIDIRNNGGGLISNSEGLASPFFKEKTLTGYLLHKTGDGHSDFSKPFPIYTEPNEKLQWERPVVIIMNRTAYSATNDFICRMQYAPNALLLGDKSGGGGGLPFSSELPNGWMVRFSTSPMLDASKNNTEWGIDPQLNISLNKADEEAGFDTLIEAAISEIDNML